MQEERTVKYANDTITVLWRPDRCIHSAICIKGLGNVYDVRRKKWIEVNADTPEQIANQIDKCPSKALAYEWNATTFQNS